MIRVFKEGFCWWRLQPGTLLSLWDMKDFYAKGFFHIAKELQSFISSGKELKESNLSLPISKETRLVVANLISLICNRLDEDGGDFRNSRSSAKSLCIRLDSGEGFTVKMMMREAEMLQRSIEVDLMNIRALYVPYEEAKLYADSEPFGPLIAKKFKKFDGDIIEAAKCLALDRHTAVVFHLMRVTEYGVQRLGRRILGRSVNVQGMEWGPILRDINKNLNPPQGRGQPRVQLTLQQRARRQKYFPATALLTNVKNAWRNKTMHPRVKGYTKEEARNVFYTVKAYLEYLAALI